MKSTQIAHAKQQPRRPGFTLIELLVVISIIAVVISLLFPAIGMMKNKAKRASCMNNVRQITQASLLFSTDNGGNLPHLLYWAYSNYPSMYSHESGELWPYLGSKEVFRCPLDLPPGDACDAWKAGSYVQKRNTNSNTRLTVRRFKANDVFFFESHGENICKKNDLESAAVEGGNARVLADRHVGGGHLSCFDGHVEYMRVEEWVRLATISGGIRNRLWPLARYD
ncbi:MAG: prepilin-type N-terminal cleavage/methylation domain-containing protein [Verrucomicrobia bacterium]|nr:prepilin-type N-terminal cleavage/methylation domain-containing protein [Verrucomicrobiota bacterium]